MTIKKKLYTRKRNDERRFNSCSLFFKFILQKEGHTILLPYLNCQKKKKTTISIDNGNKNYPKIILCKAELF